MTLASTIHRLLLRLVPVLAALKQADYGSEEDSFANLRQGEKYGVPAWFSAWLRACDKLARIDQFIARVNTLPAGETREVLVNESFVDSLIDLANYALITCALYLEHVNDLATLQKYAAQLDAASQRLREVQPQLYDSISSFLVAARILWKELSGSPPA